MLVWFKAFAFACLTVVAPAKPLFLAALFLVALDTVSGVMAARKRGEKITSAGFRRTISKGTIYIVAILAGFVGEKYLLQDLLPVSKLIAGAIGVVEVKSVLENLGVIAGGNLFASIVGKLGSINDRSVKPEPAKPEPPKTEL